MQEYVMMLLILMMKSKTNYLSRSGDANSEK